MIWALFAAFVSLSTDIFNAVGTMKPAVANMITFFICVVLSIPAVALFAFGQVVGDVRAMRQHLRVMRNYYEPDHPPR